jgi:DNA-binding PadR family transcriptional regulator
VIVIPIFEVLIPDAKESKKFEERIVKKSLDIIVLKIIKRKPMGGYSLILFIYKEFGVRLSAGTVYSLLHSLEKKGHLIYNKKNREYVLSKKGERSLILLRNMQVRIRALNRDIFEDIVFG